VPSEQREDCLDKPREPERTPAQQADERVEAKEGKRQSEEGVTERRERPPSLQTEGEIRAYAKRESRPESDGRLA